MHTNDDLRRGSVWRQRMNHELAALYGEPSMQKIAKAGRICWMGHISRKVNKTTAKLVFDTNLCYNKALSVTGYIGGLGGTLGVGRSQG